MERVTGAHGILWGTSIIGFGDYHYKYQSGREGGLVFDRLFTKKKGLNRLSNV